MGSIIHISIRRNMLYIINLSIYYYLRKIVAIILNSVYKFNDSLIFAVLMFSGAFFGGLTIFIYQKHFLKKKIKKVQYLGIELISESKKMNKRDDSIKIIFLICFAAFFNFMQFTIASFYIPKFFIVSPTATYRFGVIIILIGALLCHYNLRIKLFKHQFYSLVILAACSVFIILFEYIYRKSGTSLGDFCLVYLFVFLNLIFVAFTDIIEKYLLEFNYVNPFSTLFTESFFGLLFLSIYSIGENPFKDIKRQYEKCDSVEFIFLIFLLFLYFSFSVGTNVYKILTNGIYSPMVKTLAVYIFNPILFIYYFILGGDFLSNGERNYFYFIINMIFAIIISFFGCVYNEFLVLSFCGLDYETHYAISRRASDKNIDRYLSMNELDIVMDVDDE